MPACRDCRWFEADNFRCHIEANSRKPKRACTEAIFRKYAPLMHGEILEIGHGIVRSYRRYFKQRSMKWKGIDPRWPDEPHKHRWQATVTHMPFRNSSQDWIFGLNTMEHWSDYGDSLEDGLQEIHRILKTGGSLLLVVPIYWHGSDPFYFYQENVITSLFDTGWTDLHFEPWRRDHVPLQPQYFWNHRSHRQRRMQLMQQLNFNPPSTWMLEIYGRKA